MKKRTLLFLTACAVMMLVMGTSLAFAANVGSITPQELKKLIDSKADGIVIVDAQPKAAYDEGHIPGAVNFPSVPNIKSPGNLPKDKDLILYCACAHDEDSADLAEQLTTRFGYTRVKLLDGGWLKWIEIGYPQEKTKK